MEKRKQNSKFLKRTSTVYFYIMTGVVTNGDDKMSNNNTNFYLAFLHNEKDMNEMEYKQF